MMGMTAKGGIARVRAFLASQSWDYLVVLGTLVVVISFAVFLVAYTLVLPVSGDFHFRQSQTAVGIYYAVHEGALIPYETPVLGTPWAVTFEAPVYQTFVAALAAITGIDVVPAGRLVSFSFLLGATYFGSLIIRQLLPGDRLAPILFAALMLCAPVSLFFGRAVLIETCALFFGMAWLYYAMRAINEVRVDLAIIAGPLGLLAVLAKMTTWPAFVLAVGLFWLWDLRARKRPDLSVTATLFIGGSISLAMAFWWIGYSDAIKATGILTKDLVSGNLVAWTYGTLEDRYSARLWLESLPARMLPDALGSLWFIAVLLPFGLALQRRHLVAALSALLLFFMPLALFTNLHVVHAYYQTANDAFLIAAVAIALSVLASRLDRRLAIAAFLVLISGQGFRFIDGYWDYATADTRIGARYQAAQIVKNSTPVGSALIAFGVEWSPVLHFYAERKGLAMPGWIDKELMARILKEPAILLGDMRVGAVINCGLQSVEHRRELMAVLESYLERVAEQAQHGGSTTVLGPCTVYILPPT